MRSAALISKPLKPELSQLLPELMQWLESRDFQLFVDEESASYLENPKNVVPRDEIGSRKPEFVVVLGGDGTLLSAARAISPYGIPILGVNLGSLGFLTEVVLSDLYSTLAAVLENECRVERRAMLRCRVLRNGDTVSDFRALNDAVISKSAIARLAAFDVHINGNYVSTFRGDGVIIATPTGSTAYSLAAGGPILMPLVEALVISPICPHSLTHRPLVTRDNVKVEVIVESAGEEAFLSIDGQIGMPVMDGDRIEIVKAQEQAALFRIRKTFFDVLRKKFSWGTR